MSWLSKVGGFVSDIGGSVFDAAMGIGGTLLGDKLGQARAKDQYMYQKQLYENRYQWQMEDMRRAGLNPILSYKTGAGGAGSVSMPQTSVPDLGATARQSRTARQQIRLQDVQIDNTRADTKLKTEERYLRVQQERKAYVDKMKALEEVGTAKQLRRLKEMEADRMAKHGDSAVGRTVDTVEKEGRRLKKNFYDPWKRRMDRSLKWPKGLRHDRRKR